LGWVLQDWQSATVELILPSMILNMCMLRAIDDLRLQVHSLKLHVRTRVLLEFDAVALLAHFEAAVRLGVGVVFLFANGRSAEVEVFWLEAVDVGLVPDNAASVLVFRLESIGHSLHMVNVIDIVSELTISDHLTW
jgi:hypothetical protein